MTEREFLKLKPGDVIVNKRAPGVGLVVQKVGEDGSITVRWEKHVTGKDFWINRIRYLEFQPKYRQERIPGV